MKYLGYESQVGMGLKIGFYEEQDCHAQGYC